MSEQTRATHLTGLAHDLIRLELVRPRQRGGRVTEQDEFLAALCPECMGVATHVCEHCRGTGRNPTEAQEWARILEWARREDTPYAIAVPVKAVLWAAARIETLQDIVAAKAALAEAQKCGTKPLSVLEAELAEH